MICCTYILYPSFYIAKVTLHNVCLQVPLYLALFFFTLFASSTSYCRVPHLHVAPGVIIGLVGTYLASPLNMRMFIAPIHYIRVMALYSIATGWD